MSLPEPDVVCSVPYWTDAKPSSNGHDDPCYHVFSLPKTPNDWMGISPAFDPVFIGAGVPWFNPISFLIFVAAVPRSASCSLKPHVVLHFNYTI